MNPMSADRMMAEIAKVLPSDSIIINDAVTSAEALLNSFDFTEPGSIFGGRGGALGWGMGGAMGVKLANPDRPVVAIDGDGSAMMTVQGLWTAANDEIPVVYVVCNNSEYRILKLNMDIYKDLALKQPGLEDDLLGQLDILGAENLGSTDGGFGIPPGDDNVALQDIVAEIDAFFRQGQLGQAVTHHAHTRTSFGHLATNGLGLDHV